MQSYFQTVAAFFGIFPKKKNENKKRYEELLWDTNGLKLYFMRVKDNIVFYADNIAAI